MKKNVSDEKREKRNAIAKRVRKLMGLRVRRSNPTYFDIVELAHMEQWLKGR